MSALTDIVQWSTDRPAWQRDALRRLVLQGAISREDVAELASMAKEQCGIVEDESTLQPEPLCPDHLPVAAMAQPVSLVSIANAENVNALAGEQTLEFQPGGLTVIYGDNASGKSGYVRILKKVCRARAADTPILPNVYEPEPVGHARATVAYVVGSTQAEFMWEQGIVADDDLSAVSVFDSSSAAVYVKSENDVAYVPFGLDLLPKLVEICKEIKQQLSLEKSSHRSELEAIPTELHNTSSCQGLRAISKDTSANEINDLTKFTEADAGRKEGLDRVLAEQQPEQRAAEVATKKARYERLHASLETLPRVINTERLLELQLAESQWREAMEAAALAAGQLAGNLPAEVTASNLWRTLWQAAEEYFQELHDDHDAALDGGADRCPLCQQALDQNAQARLTAFAEYFLAKASDDEATMRLVFDGLLRAFADLDLGESQDTDVIEELKLDNEVLAGLVNSYLIDCRTVQNYAASLEDDRDEQEPAPTVAYLELRPLFETIELVDLYSKQLISASDPENGRLLRDEANELAAKKWLSEHKQQIEEEVQRLLTCSRLDDALSHTVTTGITAKTTELTRTYVTDGLRTSFETELEQLTSIAPRVELVARPGEQGVSFYRLQLVGAGAHEANIGAVLSEGEQRAISLAAFLSELSTEESQSAVVFDDPISSLDVRNRERVARRLVSVASDRQVIIFTHDLFFLTALLDHAKSAHVDTASLMVDTLPSGTGYVSEEVPWVIESLKRQIRTLRERCREARGNVDVASFRSLVKGICADFREAIERAVEQVLLRDIVRRYRRQLHVSDVLDLQAIDLDDLQLLDELMTDYSSLQHLQEVESHVTPPDVDRIERDLDRLEEWRSSFERKVRELRNQS